MSEWPAARATFRFHAGAGARVALRNSVVATAVALFLLGMAPNPLRLLVALASSLAAAHTPPWALYLIALLGAALARHATPQVAAAALASVLLAVHGGFVGLVAALPSLAVADALAGRTDRSARSTRWQSLERLPQHIAWRAMSWRAFPPLLAAALPLAAAWFYRVNNDLNATAEAGEVLLIGGVIVTALAVTPWSILACVVATPLALRFATRRERDRPVSPWLELHHSAEGDGLSWSSG